MKASKKIKKQLREMAVNTRNTSFKVDEIQDRLTYFNTSRLSRFRITDKDVFVTCIVVLTVVSICSWLNINPF